VELVSITSGALSAQINPLGAELWSLTDPSGAQYMTDADPAFWTGHAPLLFPIVGSLRGDTYRHGGQEYRLPRHGFARRSTFTLVEQSVDAVTFALEDSAATRAVYPFAFRLELRHAITGTTLSTTATVHNTGHAPMPFSLGYHHAFAWPLPGGADKADHRITFAADEPGAIHRVGKADGLILPETEPTPVRGRELALDRSLFEADAMIWTGLNSRALSYGAGSKWLDISFPDSPDLGLWQVPGANYICIEPWAGHADPQGFEGEISEKPGIILLPQGEARTFRMDVRVS
jgi:galactose mutarotase-like enzyme